MKKCSSELFMKYDYESITLNIVLRQILFYSIDFFPAWTSWLLSAVGCCMGQRHFVNVGREVS